MPADLGIILRRDRQLAGKRHQRGGTTLLGQLGNTLGFGRHGVLRQGFDPTGWNVHQIQRTNIQLAHFCQAGQCLHQDRRARTRGSTAEAFEIRDPGRTGSGEQSLQVGPLFRRNGGAQPLPQALSDAFPNGRDQARERSYPWQQHFFVE